MNEVTDRCFRLMDVPQVGKLEQERPQQHFHMGFTVMGVRYIHEQADIGREPPVFCRAQLQNAESLREGGGIRQRRFGFVRLKVHAVISVAA